MSSFYTFLDPSHVKFHASSETMRISVKNCQAFFRHFLSSLAKLKVQPSSRSTSGHLQWLAKKKPLGNLTEHDIMTWQFPMAIS